MSIKCDDYGQISVITLNGDFAGEDIAQVRAAVEDQIDQKQIVDFVIDFEKSGFIDSEGLETLVWIRQRTDDLFGQVKLANLDENLKTILDITRLSQRFECHGELANALKTMR